MIAPDVPATIRYEYVDTVWPTDALNRPWSPKLLAQTEALTAQMSAVRPDAGLYGSTPIPPSWLASAEKVIQDSTAAADAVELDTGRWLRRDVAVAGLSFLREAADLLPGEPYFYSSHAGDLVADVVSKRSTITSIISPTFTLLFAVVDGITREPRRVDDVATLRAELRSLLQVVPSSHGEVAAPE
jgi:hypothetical protein